MLTLIFWISLLLLLYIYLGYPLVAYVLGRAERRVHRDDDYQPSVTILIAAYNEAGDIEATLRNKQALVYPADKLEILVISDESDDGTDAIVGALAQDSPFNIRLFRQSPRQGKTAGLNRLVPEARGDIIAFSDANSQWDAMAVARLVRNFADEQVGYVTGKMVYVNEAGHLVGDGCSAYMKYENALRVQETRIGSIVGVDGGIDAMRKSLYQPLRADQLPDFVQPLKVVEQGYRVVYEPEALLKEEALEDSASEFSMRVRVTLRALWALKDMSQLLNPLRFGVFAWQLLSHKLLRYLAFVPQILLTITALLLADRGGIYGLCLLGLVAVYLCAWLGRKRERDGRHLPFYLAAPYYLMLLNLACYRATRSFVRGEKKVIWNPRKG
ncbi:glycosyltransferase family 2 protein [Marinobacter bohaiensis]|uniref:glycosyltransferase family 2 protein n=1 Tax=Marinobacter bohaiensis TaxID=2201898 RepID=UPI000DAE87C3|nr:glycosyltransferase family 2 protein [Marinobacter bohaiensis]